MRHAGAGDDVNKALWSALYLEPSLTSKAVIEQYARHFFHGGVRAPAAAPSRAESVRGLRNGNGETLQDAAATGVSLLFSLERNWEGDAASNVHVLASLAFAEDLERLVLAKDASNWRVLAHVYRAYYDAHAQARLRFEQQRQANAYEAIAVAAGSASCDPAEAQAVLLAPFDNVRAAKWEGRLHQLAAAINSSSTLCGGCAGGGMAILLAQAPLLSLDTLHTPLADHAFLRARLQRISKLGTVAERRMELRSLLTWANPGPTGFYDQLGVSPRSPRLELGYGAAADPQYVFAPLIQFNEDSRRWPPCGKCGAGDGEPQRLAWLHWAQTYGDAPLSLRYDGLVADALYVVRIVYSYQGWGAYPLSRLYATGATGEKALLHDYMPAPKPTRPLEFAVPQRVTSGGTVRIECRQPPGSAQDGSGRGCLISEVWLVTNATSTAVVG